MARARRLLVLAVILAAIAGIAWWAVARRTPASPAASARAGDHGPVAGGTLRASLRSEPSSFNRYSADPGAAIEAITRLTQAPLVRINRVTDALEPWLAERWTESADHRTYTLTLRPGVTFSDGVPFTSADVLFSFRALYDPQVASALAPSLKIGNRPLTATAPDAQTVVITLPSAFTPGLRLLDQLPILPRHQLASALDAHRFRDAWSLTTAGGTMAGLGPFVVSEYLPGQRITLTRNPHYWRTDPHGIHLPYLDRLVFEILTDQSTEVLRLESGGIDLMTQADVRPEDYAALRRLRDQGQLTLQDLGTSLDPNLLWFNLSPRAARDPHRQWFQHREFRQAISYGVDRTAIVNGVYLGAAEPVYGPVTPGNRTWYSAAAPAYPYDPARARALLASIGLQDRNGDGLLDDPSGTPVRFSILTQRGHTREKVAAVLQAQLKTIGITVDVVGLDPSSIFQRWGGGDYDSIYFGFQASATDPANNLDFWLSSGPTHVWNPAQRTPSVPWEAQLDDLMQRQIATPDPAARQRLFAGVQRVFGDELPAIAFVAQKVSIAMSRRVGGATPALLDPKVLWNADTLYVRDSADPR